MTKAEGECKIKAYQTVSKEACAEFIEKKSRFLATICPVSDEIEAKLFLDRIKTKHPDATHNVFAYILQGTEIARFSDDGEPQGTAGMPVLEVLKREDLTGVACVVTRYFGGILLGAGGLVRAYAKSAKLGVERAGISIFVPFITFTLTVGYSDFEKIQRDLEKYYVRLTEKTYTECVTLSLSAEQDRLDQFITFTNDLTSGKALVQITGERFEGKTIEVQRN